MTHDEIYLPHGDVLLAMIPLAYHLGMPKIHIKIWRWISHTATAVSVLGWWHFISTTIVVSAAVLTAWLREQDPIILFVVGLGAFAAMVIIFERLAAWRHRKQSSAPQKIEEPEDPDHLTERKQLVPDWRICEAMDYIAAQFGNENEENLNKKYLGPRRLLTEKARSGEIQVWGKRMVAYDQAELSRRQIPASDWNDREISIWACQPYTIQAQTDPVGQGNMQQLTDLRVRSSQIESVFKDISRSAKSWQQEWNDLAQTRHTFWKPINQVYDGWVPSDHSILEIIRKARLPIELPLDDATAFPEWANQFNPIDTDEYASALDQFASVLYPHNGISSRSLSGSEFEAFDNARRTLSKFWDKWGRQSRAHSELVKQQNFLGSAAELKLLTFLEIARARWVTTGQSAKNGLFELARIANG
jgi:hypothetical protein